MFTVMMVIFMVIFAIASVTILIGFVTTARLSGKIFRAVEQEMDRKISEGQSMADPARVSNSILKKSQCEHCGTPVTTTDRCPNCGASIT